MSKTIAQIIAEAEEIRVETDPNGNTADRVGTAIKDVAEYVEGVEDDVSQQSEDITSLQETVAGHTEEISAIGSDITSIQSNIEVINTEVADIATKVLSDYSKELTEFGYYNTNGALVATQNAKNTDKIPISGFKTLEYAGLCFNQPVVAFWDADGNFLPQLSVIGQSSNLQSGTIDLTQESYSAVASIAVNYYDSSSVYRGFKCVLSNPESFDSRINELDASLTELQDEISPLQESLDTITPKVMSNYDCDLVEYGYYQYSNGALVATQSAKNTGKIPIGGYDTLEYAAKMGSGGCVVAFWDANNQFLSSISIAGNGNLLSGTIDLSQEAYAAASFVTISYYDSSLVFRGFKCVLSSSQSYDKEIYVISNQLSQLQNLSPLKDEGLKVLIFGDSITTCATFTINENDETTAYQLRSNSNSYVNEYGETIYFSMWPALLKDFLNCSDVRNYAQSGASYKDATRPAGEERKNLSYQIQLAINDIPNAHNAFPTQGNFQPDIVIFALGTNDWTANDTYAEAMAKTVMNVDNTAFDIDATLANLDRTKFCEAARWAFVKTRQSFPYALYFCLLPIQRGTGDRIEDNEPLKQMAERYGMIIIDGAKTMGIVRDFETSSGLGYYLKDGLHPNDRGQRLFVRRIVNAIKSNMIQLDIP